MYIFLLCSNVSSHWPLESKHITADQLSIDHSASWNWGKLSDWFVIVRVNTHEQSCMQIKKDDLAESYVLSLIYEFEYL